MRSIGLLDYRPLGLPVARVSDRLEVPRGGKLKECLHSTFNTDLPLLLDPSADNTDLTMSKVGGQHPNALILRQAPHRLREVNLVPTKPNEVFDPLLNEAEQLPGKQLTGFD